VISSKQHISHWLWPSNLLSKIHRLSYWWLILKSNLHVTLLNPWQLGDFAMLYVERVTVPANNYKHSSAQNSPMAGN